MAPQADPEKGGADGETNQENWTGLGKEELLRVADTPGWNWARNILLILFWVGWALMLVAAIVIVVKVPRCPEVEWWEKSVVYQSYPRSLQDTDGDGIGDLKGVEASLDHIDSLGAKVVYLTSIFKERNATSTDTGYDIVDHGDVDPVLGSLDDFDSLVAAATEKGMKVVLEFVPNHSSDEHPWFKDSMMSQDGEYSDFYVWADGVNGGPPNDWKNKNGETAWVLSEERGQYFYAYNGPQLPDLNYNNDTLRKEVLDILEEWLSEHKVDGFVFTDVDYIFEPPVTTVAPARRRRQAATSGTTAGVTTAPGETPPAAGETTAMKTGAATNPGSGPPEPEPEPTNPLPPQYATLEETDSELQEKLMMLLKEWRDLMNGESYLGKYRLMATSSEVDNSRAVQMYGNGTYLADYPLNMRFLDTFDGDLSGDSLKMSVTSWLNAKKSGNVEKRWNTWMLGCHDRSRIATRAGAAYVDALNTLLLTLPGTPFLYYGEEIGMADVPVPDSTDPRDPERTPLPWKNMTNAGFTWKNATAYLPLPADYATNNVEMQMKKPDSTLSLLKELSALHAEPSLVAGGFTSVTADANVFAYLRDFSGWPRYLVLVNVGSDASHDLYTMYGEEHKLKMDGKIVFSTRGMETRSGKVSLDGLETKGGEGLIIKL